MGEKTKEKEIKPNKCSECGYFKDNCIHPLAVQYFLGRLIWEKCKFFEKQN